MTTMRARSEMLLVRGCPILVLVGLALVGCDTKDPEKCRQGQEGVRASLKANDAGALVKWREFAFKQCDEGEFQALDREIQEHKAAQAQAEAEAKKKKAENDQLITVYLDWIGTAKANPASAAAAKCEGEGEAEKKQERWCVGDRMAGPHRLDVIYWEKEPVAASFKTTVPHPITCADLGAHTVVRSFTVQGSIKRHVCQLTGGPAAGLQALVTEAPNAPIEVFSARMVELHPGLKKKVEGG